MFFIQEFHMTLNMISPETHSTVLEVIESCRVWWEQEISIVSFPFHVFSSKMVRKRLCTAYPPFPCSIGGDPLVYYKSCLRILCHGLCLTMNFPQVLKKIYFSPFFFQPTVCGLRYLYMKKDYDCVTTIVICSNFLVMVSFSGNMLCTFSYWEKKTLKSSDFCCCTMYVSRWNNVFF